MLGDRNRSRGPRISRFRPGWAASIALVLPCLSLHPDRRVEARQGDAKVPAPLPAATAATLVEAKLKATQRALQLIDNSLKLGVPVRAFGPERIFWSTRDLEARIYLSLGPDESKTEDIEVYLNQAKGPPNEKRIAAFKIHLDRMKATERVYRPQYEQGLISPFEYVRYEYAVLQAETWLTREKERGVAAK